MAATKEHEPMGEVRVNVKLNSVLDEMLVRRGQLAPNEVRSIEADALVDTGAVTLILPSFIVEKLGVARPLKTVAQYADGRREEVDITEPVGIEVMGRRTNEEAFVLGDEVFIGQTVLEKTDLFVDTRERRLIPNPAHPDQPVLNVKRANT
ncbi:MAG: clan AA aspartic protease [Chloroflexi bacterium]|nr:clan AA aspartic protease [Chloroflexota bacterium]